MNSPKVFIIILNYNGKEFIKKTLSGVLRINYPNFEVVLVDNNSEDGSFELIKREFSKIILIKNSENLGFSAGNNIGIEYALERGAEYIFLLNYDTEVEKNFLTPLIEIMEEDKRIGIASPIILNEDGSAIWFSGGKISWLKMKSYHEDDNKKDNYFNSNYLSGCAMLIRSEIFQKVGLFDEDYFLYWEDADFSVRAKRAGYKLAVCPKSRIIHLEKSQEKKEKKIYWLVISGLIFFKKNSSLIFRPYIFFYVLLRRLKNWKDVRRKKNTINEAVQKAYRDFKYVK
jgi:GT2 family glycosyltransferase